MAANQDRSCTATPEQNTAFTIRSCNAQQGVAAFEVRRKVHAEGLVTALGLLVPKVAAEKGFLAGAGAPNEDTAHVDDADAITPDHSARKSCIVTLYATLLSAPIRASAQDDISTSTLEEQ